MEAVDYAANFLRGCSLLVYNAANQLYIRRIEAQEHVLSKIKIKKSVLGA